MRYDITPQKPIGKGYNSLPYCKVFPLAYHAKPQDYDLTPRQMQKIREGNSLKQSWPSARFITQDSTALALGLELSPKSAAVADSLIVDALVGAAYWRHIAVPMRAEAYNKTAIGLTYRPTMAALGELGRAGLIYVYKAPSGRPTGVCSFITATPALVENAAHRALQGTEITHKEQGALMRFNPLDGTPYPLPMTARVIAKRKRVAAINEAIGACRLSFSAASYERDGGTVYTDPLLPLLGKTDLYRVFNDRGQRDKLSLGGRHVGGGWQSIHREARALILIDGQETVEPDYSGMQPNIALSLATGKPLVMEAMRNDFYGFAGAEKGMQEYQTAKGAMMAALCSDSRAKAVRAVSWREGKSLSQADLYMQKLERANPELAKSFYRDMGPRLQNVESRTADIALSKMAKKGVTCLPTFDSFTVKKPDLQHALESMGEAINRATREAIT